MNAPPPRTPGQDSRGSAVLPGVLAAPAAARAGLALAGFAGAILLVVADFSTLFEVKVVTAVVKTVDGHSNHAWAMLLLGLAALPMAWAATRHASRPAMAALAAIGAVAALIVLAVDLPDVNATGVIGERFSDAAASPRTGFYLESLGAALLLVAGVGGLVLTAPGRRTDRPRPAAGSPSQASSD